MGALAHVVWWTQHLHHLTVCPQGGGAPVADHARVSATRKARSILTNYVLARMFCCMYSFLEFVSYVMRYTLLGRHLNHTFTLLASSICCVVRSMLGCHHTTTMYLYATLAARVFEHLFIFLVGICEPYVHYFLLLLFCSAPAHFRLPTQPIFGIFLRPPSDRARSR